MDQKEEEKDATENLLPHNGHDQKHIDDTVDPTSKEKPTEQQHDTANGHVDSLKIDKGPPWWRSQRYILAYILFGGMMNVFFQRVNLSIAIICMVNHTAIELHEKLTQGGNQTLHSPDSHVSMFRSHNESNLFIPDRVKSTSRQGNHSFSNNFHPVTGNKSLHNNPSFSISSGAITSRTFSGHATVEDSESGVVLRRYDKISQNLTDVTEYQPDEICGGDNFKSIEKKEDGPFLWTKKEQGILLGAMYWTYMFVQIPGNHFVRNMRKKVVILVSMGIMSLMTMLIHVAALWSLWAVFVIKLIQGGCTALSVVAIYGMWAKWAPPNERVGLISLSISGQMFANIIVFPVSGLLCKYGFLGGWPSVFYVFGIISFIWLVLCYFLTEESPDTHRLISPKERLYITSSLPSVTFLKQPKTPWLSILSSPPFWGIVAAHVSFTWGLFLFLSTLPQYMNEVLKFDIESNGLFSMLPYIALFLVTQIASQLSDYVVKNQIVRPIWVRKGCVSIAFMVPAVLLIPMSFLDCTQAKLAIVLLVTALGATGFGLCGILVSPYDIAPRFVIVIMSISNSLATIPGIVAPYVVAAITKDQTREQWQMVFFLTSAIYTAGTLGFCFLARGEVQPWAQEERVEIEIPLEAGTSTRTSNVNNL